MRIAPTIALALLLAHSAHGQGSGARAATAGPTTATARTLLRLEDDWTRGVVRRDTAMFRRLLATGFVYTENADVMGKEEVIRGVVGDDRVERAENHEMKVHDFGTTAVVTGILQLVGKGKAGPFDRRYRFTDSWMRRDGRWQIIAAQDYLLPK
jgi:ketosteroid isomerase-like protein